MAVPYGMWPPGMGGQVPAQTVPQHPGQMPMQMMGGMPYGYMPHNIAYAIPAIPPSSNPLVVVDPDLAIRDYTEHATNADPKQMCDVWTLKNLEDWGKDDTRRKVILEVLKGRLDLPWPQNYKALDVLAVMPPTSLLELHDKLKLFAESPAAVVGSNELKKLAKPLLDKVEAEKKKMEEEEMKKKQEAIAAMWGGLWADQSVKAPALAGYAGWQYPYQVVPGLPAQSTVQWTSKAPEGWTPSGITPTPQVYPFSRTGYYALIPPDTAPKDPPKPTTFTFSVTAQPSGGRLHRFDAPTVAGVRFSPLHPVIMSGRCSAMTKAIPLGLDQLSEIWEEQRQERGW